MTTDQIERVAFLGMGMMAAPMAERLIGAGFELAVWNRTAAKAAPLEAQGARLAATSEEAVRNAQVVCLCVLDGAAVEAVLFGPEGAIKALGPASLVIDFSTVGPLAAREISERVKAETGARWLDCPVSGGVAGAKAGSLIVLAGGDPEDLQRAEPVLGAVSSKVTRMGGVGAGQAAKLCNQLIVSTNLVAIAQAMALGRALGVEVKRLPDALKGGFADSLPLQIFGPSLAPEDGGLGAPVLSVMHKDVREIIAAAESSGAPADLVRFVEAFYRAWLKTAASA